MEGLKKTQEQVDKLKSLQESFNSISTSFEKLANESAIGISAELQQGKQSLVDAIEYKGGESSADKTLQGIAEDIKEIPNFPTTGFEYISEIYRPRTLMEAYNNKSYLTSVVNNFIEEISGNHTFGNCTFLQSVNLPNLVKISGTRTFEWCTSMQTINLPSLVEISGSRTFYNCSLLQSVQLPNLTTISTNLTFQECRELKGAYFPKLVEISHTQTFTSSDDLQYLELGKLIRCEELFYNKKAKLRNITIGQDTNINLPFQLWGAASVIGEGQSGIDELNNNLRTNLLEKLYDHSNDGETRTLRLGWLAHVTQENIDYANSKGWTLTT